MIKSIEEVREYIVSTETVAHVTFYLVKDKFDDTYSIYTESKDRGLARYRGDGGFCDSWDYRGAIDNFRKAIHDLEATLEMKRKSIPTAKQLHFLFCHGIPIPLTLTWGEASDLIEEKLHQIAYEKQTKQQALLDQFNGFAVKDRVTYKPNPKVTGAITKLWEVEGSKWANFRPDGSRGVWGVVLDNLQKIVEVGE